MFLDLIVKTYPVFSYINNKIKLLKLMEVSVDLNTKNAAYSIANILILALLSSINIRRNASN